MTPVEQDTSDPPPTALAGFSLAERERLRGLAQRYRVRENGTIRPVADVTYSLRLRHKLDVTVPDVHWLLTRRESR